MKTKSIYFLLLTAFSCGNSTSLNEDSTTKIVQANGKDAVFNFEKEVAGKLPSDWIGPTGTWTIAADENNKVMKQTGKSDGDYFNICVLSKLNYQSLEMEVKIKAMQGDEDQGGGLVWRYQDSKNYYIARANPLENNFRVYSVVNGKRKQLESANVKMKTGEWFTIKVVMRGNAIECYYNGQKLLRPADDTFPNAGLVGFWSKADAVSMFDDLSVKTLK